MVGEKAPPARAGQTGTQGKRLQPQQTWMLRESVDHMGGSSPRRASSARPYGGVVRCVPTFQMGTRAMGPFGDLPEVPAHGLWLGAQAWPRASRALRSLLTDRLWVSRQLYHACNGPGLSVLCFLRHDILEYFSVYGTALSMWVSLMGEWPPPVAQPCAGDLGPPPPTLHSAGRARRPPPRRLSSLRTSFLTRRFRVVLSL